MSTQSFSAITFSLPSLSLSLAPLLCPSSSALGDVVAAVAVAVVAMLSIFLRLASALEIEGRVEKEE